MPTNALGDRLSRPADADEGFDSRGYLLTVGDDGGNHVKKTQASTDQFVGVNYRSTLNLTDSAVDNGRPVAVQVDGYGPVLCEGDHEYEIGDPIYVSSTAGVGTADSDTGDATRVGTVYDEQDLTGETGAHLVQVSFVGSASTSGGD